MRKHDCQCADHACSDEAGIATTANKSAVRHNHGRLPSVLRYRGLENEAVMAARLVKVESLIANLQSVLDDIGASVGVQVDPGGGVEREAGMLRNDTSGEDAQGIARRHAQFVEQMLETALSKIHAGIERDGEQPRWRSEPPFDGPARGAKRDTNDKSTGAEEHTA